jgi:tRNA A-37 threonylcarbamoyl transferase component Bud32
MTRDDRVVLERWWQAFRTTGTVPAELARVQGRLVRAVHRGALPSGPVHVKAMTFPRPKDRLRYAFRALPGAHEAAMLRAVAAAGIPCPEVVDVRGERRGGLPSRSWLVLRTLPSQPLADDSPRDRLLAEAALARRLLAAGIVHRDLHRDNFLRLPDGRLAVLDLQSARLAGRAATSTAVRLATAARLLRERPGLDDGEAVAALREAGLLVDDHESPRMLARIAAERQRYRRTRVWRCLGESTEFTRRVGWAGIEHRLRGVADDGRWIHGGRELRRAWLGQRVLQLDTGRTPTFSAYFEKWYWLGGGASLYVPARCSGERIPVEVETATDAWSAFVATAGR